MLRATLLPVLIFGICIIICSARQTESSVYQEVESGLENVAQMTMYLYEETYPGDYAYDSASKTLYKGGKKVEGASKFLEHYKECSGTDVTIFYKDVRVITTIKDKNGLLGRGSIALLKKRCMRVGRHIFIANRLLKTKIIFLIIVRFLTKMTNV